MMLEKAFFNITDVHFCQVNDNLDLRCSRTTASHGVCVIFRNPLGMGQPNAVYPEHVRRPCIKQNVAINCVVDGSMYVQMSPEKEGNAVILRLAL